MRQDFSYNIYILYEYLVKNSANGIVRINIKEVSKSLNVSERSIYRYIRYLLENGYISKIAKGVYRINPLPLNLLNTTTHTNVSLNSKLDIDNVINLLASAISPQAINKFVSYIIKEYRLHNIVIYLRVTKNITSLYKLPEKIVNKNYVAQIYKNKNSILLQFKDSWHFEANRYSITDVLFFLMKLPYIIANDIENKMFLGIDYTSVELKFFELAIVFNDAVDSSIIESLASIYSKFANNELQVDYSNNNTELEFRGKSFKLLFELLSLMNPILILEHIRQDLIIDKQILSILKDIQKQLDELKNKIDKNLNIEK